jgi:hypothetical protein
LAREQEKKQGWKSKQKTTLESAEPIMGSPERRNHKTYDLNPSSVAQSKSCKKMGENLEKTPSLEEASPIATIARPKIVMA